MNNAIIPDRRFGFSEIENMKNMKINEELTLRYSTKVIRVPSGWIYKIDNTATFVPEVC